MNQSTRTVKSVADKLPAAITSIASPISRLRKINHKQLDAAFGRVF
jgi:hypothetical protein